MEKVSFQSLEHSNISTVACPSCQSYGVSIFYEIRNVPAHSVLLLETREEALSCSKGEIVLGFCQSCGLVTNIVFDEKLHSYSSKYESSQAFSPTFNTFSERLAENLVEWYGLRNKSLIEIGCGQGEFITLMAQLGGNHCIGFDPAYEGSRKYNNITGLLNHLHSDTCKGCVTFISNFYSDKYQIQSPDFICCKMTLEHIHDTSNFVRNVRNSLGNDSEAIVFFQVPEFTRILDELAFWDIYYEHCSYFVPSSLSYLFSSCGFHVRDVWTDYNDQYLMIEAVVNKNGNADHPVLETNIENLRNKVNQFSSNYGQKLERWRDCINKFSESKLKVVLWGSSSKAVSFLTTLDISYQKLEYVVDINPYRQGSYMAGTGQEIVSPEFLRDYRPDIVIVMNPIYLVEIGKHVNSMKLAPKIITVTDA